MGSKGISSSIIGSPTSSSPVGVVPKGYRPPRREGESGGIFSPQYSAYRLLDKAASARKQAREKVEEARSAQRVQDSKYTIEHGNEEVGKRLEENKEIEFELEKRRKELSHFKDKERKEQEIRQIQETEKKLDDVNWKMKNFSPGSSIETLKYLAAVKGDRDALEIIQAIGKNDWNKAKKLVDRREKKLNEAFALKSRIESEEGKNILRSIGFKQNSAGQYIPSEQTAKIAEDDFDVALTAAELAEMKETPIAVPPQLSAQEIQMLNSESGRRRLREWGFAKGTLSTTPELGGSAKTEKPLIYGSIISGVITK